MALSSDLEPRHSIAMGSILIATGVIAAAAGAGTGHTQVIATLPVICAALATAGIVAVTGGARMHEMRTQER